MAPDSSFLLGEYGARLDALEQSVRRIDQNVAFLVSAETERRTKEKQRAVYMTTAGGFVGAILAFLAGVVKEWLVP